jgi:N-acetyl-gamma-glutamyl-phosphate reductase
MTPLVFIDGAAGTTGLEIAERLAPRDDLRLLTLSDDKRKDAIARREALNEADVVILCLPDDAARESVSLIDNDRTAVIDASTAHRVAPGWVYGFPELEAGQREKIASAKRIANPGCWPTGFLALVRPLVLAGLIPADWPVTVSGASGYSGGGKAMIAEFEGADGVPTAFRAYGLPLGHKHLPEMQQYAGLTHVPLFAPAVAAAYRGMLVEVPLQLAAMPGKPAIADIHAALAAAHAGSPIVTVAPLEPAPAALHVEDVGATDRLTLHVCGGAASGQARLIAILDNLGKGAGGAAVQNLNLLAGLPETAGLRL